MRGMKKRGKGMNKAKKSKKCLAFLIVLLFVIGTLIAPAAAGKGDKQSIKIIDEKLEAIDDDPIINSFLYDRMLEYNNSKGEGIEAVKIVVIKGHWWRGKKVVKTFYIVRNDTASGIDIVDIYTGDDDLWTFYPNIGQTIGALNVLLSHESTVSNVIRMGIRAILVDKENVPGITEIIYNSPWASSYLPDWAKNFLNRFEGKH